MRIRTLAHLVACGEGKTEKDGSDGWANWIRMGWRRTENPMPLALIDEMGSRLCLVPKFLSPDFTIYLSH